MSDSVTRVLNLMRDTFGSEFKAYYDGDPEVIPNFNMPCIVVTQTKDDTTEGQQGEDDVSDEIRIKIVLDKRDDWKGDKVDSLNMTEKRIRDYIAAEGNGRYASRTVKGALRNALLDGVEAIAPTMAVEYGINPRETLGSADNVSLTAEGWVTFAIEHSVQTY